MVLFNNNKNAYVFLAACALIYFFPFFIYGKNTIFPIVDSLDCYYVWNKIVAQPQYAWGTPSTIITEYMNGLPRFTLVNSYSVFFFLNLFFSSFYAATFHIILIHTVAAFSMYAFCIKYLTKGNIVAAILAAVVFGFREYTYAFGLSISLLPVLIMVFINFVKGEEGKKDWLFLLAYPLLSNFQSVGVFIVSVWFLLSLFYFFKDKKIGIKLFVGILIMTGLYYLNNFPTLNNLLFNSYFISHRKAFMLNGIAHQMGNIASIDEPHNLAFYAKHIFARKIFILCGIILYSMYRSKHRHFKLLLSITIAMIFFQCREIILDSAVLKFLQEKFMLLRMYHFYKMFVFEVFFQAMAYAIIAAYLMSIFKFSWLKYALLLLMFPFAVRLSLFWKPIIGTSWQQTARPFQGYYSPDLFDKIKQNIPLPVDQYKVASFGIDPAVASYNGLYTVDGYINNYPLEYRNKFKEVIKEDLVLIHQKFGPSEFETRGHFCYLQTVALIERGDFQVPSDKLNPMTSPQTVHWNFSALKNLGCSYIISSVEIENSNNSLLFVNQFENSSYKLFLYKIQ